VRPCCTWLWSTSCFAGLHDYPGKALLPTFQTLSKLRRFECKTLGCDISERALKYGKAAGIFDEIMVVDINNLSTSQEKRLFNALKKAQFVHLGAPGYIDLEHFDYIVETFASGDGYGVLIVTFNYLFMKHHKQGKRI